MVFKKLLKRLACRPGKAAVDEEIGLNENFVDRISNTKKQSSSNKRGSNKTANRKKEASVKNPYVRYYQELLQRDPFIIEEVDGQCLDIQESLAPRPKWPIAPVKLAIIVWAFLILVDGVIDTYPRSFYLATFDHWSLVASILYLASSFLCNLLRPPSRTKGSEAAEESYLPTVWHKITWGLFAIAAPSQILSSLIFWIIEFQPYGDSMQIGFARHVSIWILLLIEGFVINRMPLRVNHQWFFFAFIYMFLFWSLIHSYTKIGNPSFGNNKYDALYPFLHWNKHPVMSVLYCLISMFIVAPVMYWFVWMLSLFACPATFSGMNRRYLKDNESQKLESYVELDELDT